MTEISSLMLQEKDPLKLDVSDISSWVFDLDNTIYPAHQSLFPRVAKRMIDWIEQNFKLDRTEAEDLKTRLFLEYGTTMNGLTSEFSVEPEDFLSYVHDIDLSDLSYDGELDAGISALPGKNISTPTAPFCMQAEYLKLLELIIILNSFLIFLRLTTCLNLQCSHIKISCL